MTNPLIEGLNKVVDNLKSIDKIKPISKENIQMFLNMNGLLPEGNSPELESKLERLEIEKDFYKSKYDVATEDASSAMVENEKLKLFTKVASLGLGAAVGIYGGTKMSAIINKKLIDELILLKEKRNPSDLDKIKILNLQEKLRKRKVFSQVAMGILGAGAGFGIAKYANGKIEDLSKGDAGKREKFRELLKKKTGI